MGAARAFPRQGRDRHLSDIGWLAIALVTVWVAIGGYAATLGVRQRRIERRLDDLARRDADR
jgi:CcmD family protein